MIGRPVIKSHWMLCIVGDRQIEDQRRWPGVIAREICLCCSAITSCILSACNFLCLAMSELMFLILKQFLVQETTENTPVVYFFYHPGASHDKESILTLP